MKLQKIRSCSPFAVTNLAGFRDFPKSKSL